MHYQSLLVVAGAVMTVANPLPGLALRDVSFGHFETEGANKAAPPVDLSAYGFGKQLPKVYDFTPEGQVYNAEKSHQAFLDTLAGKFNASGAGERRDLDKRADPRFAMTLNGDRGSDFAADKAVNSPGCGMNFPNAPWNSVIVHSIDDAYLTFWASGGCNGQKGSFNPICYSRNNQECRFKFRPSSFKAYAGCHSQFANDGCS